MAKPEDEFDAFMSHSSADKADFVRPLVEVLAEHGLRVWYDEYSLKPGDSLATSIDRGLSAAPHGLVVISPAFIETATASGWTRQELNGLVANVIGEESRRIIPIWLDVTRKQVHAFSPTLVDRVAIVAAGKHVDQVALEIIEAIAPDRAGSLRRKRWLADRQGGETEVVDLRKLVPSPPFMRKVPGSVVLRSVLVTTALESSG